jgi:hypothetical protein
MDFVWAIIRISFVIQSIRSHHDSAFVELPFISPVLWTDWLLLTDLGGHISILLQGFFTSIAMVMLGVCFWLCIGYSQLGYGVRQYEVLAIPWACQGSVWHLQYAPREKSHQSILPLKGQFLIRHNYDKNNWKNTAFEYCIYFTFLQVSLKFQIILSRERLLFMLPKLSTTG